MLTNLMPSTSLAELSSDALTTRLAELRGAERRSLVEFLWCLGEMDRRRTHLDLGYPSLFAYCTDALRLPKASAFRRTTSARLLVRFPVAAEYLANGRLCLTTFVLLKDVLQPEDHVELLDRAAGKTEEQVEVLVASLRPCPEVKESIRRLPSRASATVESPTIGSGPEPATASLFAASAASADAAPARTAGHPSGLDSTVHVAAAPNPRPRLKPIDAERHSLKMTVGPEFMEELKQVTSALSHAVPDGNLEAVLRLCMQKTLELCARRKRAARSAPASTTRVKKPATAAAEPPCGSGPEPERSMSVARSRTIPAEVRRAVWDRDRGNCSFIGTHGKRCGSTHQLEFDHVHPFALGGVATVANVALRCRVHNQHRARAHFGEAHMAQFKRAPLVDREDRPPGS